MSWRPKISMHTWESECIKLAGFQNKLALQSLFEKRSTNALFVRTFLTCRTLSGHSKTGQSFFGLGFSGSANLGRKTLCQQTACWHQWINKLSLYTVCVEQMFFGHKTESLFSKLVINLNDSFSGGWAGVVYSGKAFAKIILGIFEKKKCKKWTKCWIKSVSRIGSLQLTRENLLKGKAEYSGWDKLIDKTRLNESTCIRVSLSDSFPWSIQAYSFGRVSKLICQIFSATTFVLTTFALKFLPLSVS
jgi:hypothetical protein